MQEIFIGNLELVQTWKLTAGSTQSVDCAESHGGHAEESAAQSPAGRGCAGTGGPVATPRRYCSQRQSSAAGRGAGCASRWCGGRGTYNGSTNIPPLGLVSLFFLIA